MTETLLEKAWTIDKRNFSQPWHVPEQAIYGETQNKARSAAIQLIKYDDLEHTNGNVMDYLNIRVFRAKGADKYDYEGRVMTKHQIAEHKALAARELKLRKMVDTFPDALAYIKKGGVYYRAGYAGYTEYIIEAGVYSIKDAVNAVLRTSLQDQMRAVIFDKEVHNKMIQEKIDELKTRLIA